MFSTHRVTVLRFASRPGCLYGVYFALAAERHRVYSSPLLILIGNHWRLVHLVVRLPGTGTRRFQYSDVETADLRCSTHIQYGELRWELLVREWQSGCECGLMTLLAIRTPVGMIPERLFTWPVR